MNDIETLFSGKPLAGKTVLLTGGGGGIGLETARAFVNMGASVLLAEINKDSGCAAADSLNSLRSGSAVFYQTDLSDEQQIYGLFHEVMNNHGCPDVLFHNAAVVKVGSIDELTADSWKNGYAVNLNAPFLLTKLFLPQMKKRNSGIIVFVSSSGAAPFMGAYEIFKTSQVELSNTLAMELEQTNVHPYTIGPGLVRTKTAEQSIEIIAAGMGMTLEEFYGMNNKHILDAQSAGLGFALSVLKADEYHGQEISSIQVLNDFMLTGQNISPSSSAAFAETANRNADSDTLETKDLLNKISDTFAQQYAGWKSMNVFERQWVLRDFKKSMGMPAEMADKELRSLIKQAGCAPAGLNITKEFFEKLLSYWKRQLKLLQGYEKDPGKLAENSLIIEAWISDIEKLLS